MLATELLFFSIYKSRRYIYGFARLCLPRQPFFMIQKWWVLSIYVFCPFSRETNWHKLKKVY